MVSEGNKRGTPQKGAFKKNSNPRSDTEKTAVVWTYKQNELQSNGQISGFYRATACNATHGIAVGILSVRPSVCPSVRPSDACIVTKLNNALRIF